MSTPNQYTVSDLFPEEEKIIPAEHLDTQGSAPGKYTVSDLFPEEVVAQEPVQPPEIEENGKINRPEDAPDDIPDWMFEPATIDTAGNLVHPLSDDIIDAGQSLGNADPEQLLSSEIAKNVENKMALPEQDTGPLPYQQAVSNVERQIYGIMETKPELIVNNPMLAIYKNPRQMAEGLNKDRQCLLAFSFSFDWNLRVRMTKTCQDKASRHISLECE